VSRDNAQRADRHGLKLVRDDHDAAVSAAVSALDSRIDRVPTPAPCAYASVISVGTLEKLKDPTRHEHVAFILYLLGGRRMLVSMPLELDGDDVFDAVSNLADVVLAKMEP
jgi:hypothetical protein